jgi:hypothetical protein
MKPPRDVPRQFAFAIQSRWFPRTPTSHTSVVSILAFAVAQPTIRSWRSTLGFTTPSSFRANETLLCYVMFGALLSLCLADMLSRSANFRSSSTTRSMSLFGSISLLACSARCRQSLACGAMGKRPPSFSVSQSYSGFTI